MFLSFFLAPGDSAPTLSLSDNQNKSPLSSSAASPGLRDEIIILSPGYYIYTSRSGLRGQLALEEEIVTEIEEAVSTVRPFVSSPTISPLTKDSSFSLVSSRSSLLLFLSFARSLVSADFEFRASLGSALLLHCKDGRIFRSGG